jgi:LuxR family maltose regulon positive regulatory protein
LTVSHLTSSLVKSSISPPCIVASLTRLRERCANAGEEGREDVSALAPPMSPVTVSRSKVERPLLSGQWVRRPRLEARLDRVLTRTLVVITAPAGHGKTSTIVSWLRLRGLDAAWVSVDRRDGDLTRLSAHVAVALDRVAPGIASALFALLTVPDRLGPSDLGEAFGEALYDLQRDVVLVLDDFHAATSDAVAQFVSGLLHAAPRRLHTILSSRGRPPFSLSRLRTTGEVEELTGADLRFSPQETGELLRLETGEEVESEQARSVQTSVGGCPAAIRLIAISRGADSAAQRFAVGERQEHLLLDYLGEEVLARLPLSQRDLLLRASLLERFNAPLLEALSLAEGGERIGRADLERLRALELFREIPGLAETWFAYHPLFRDVLRHELARTVDAQAIANLRRSAAGWYAAAGLTREAVRHLVEVGDIAAAATLIESRASAAFAAENWQSIASWLRLIPPSEVRQRPELLLATAWVAYLGGRDSRIAEVLETMRDPRFQHRATDAQRAEIALIGEAVEGDPERRLANAERVIAVIDRGKRYRYGFAHMELGMALTEAGRVDEALARLAAFTDRESARVDAASIRGYFARVLVLWQSGRLSQCEQTAADQLQLATMNALPVTAGWGAALLGIIAHERGQLDQADRHLAMVIADAERLHFDCVRESFFAHILSYEAQGMRQEADRAIARLRELAIAVETPRQLERVDSIAARTGLIRGDRATAERWLASSSLTLGRYDLINIEHPLLTRIKVLIDGGTRDTLAEAERLLVSFVDRARGGHFVLALLESLAVRALLHEARGEHAAASRVLRESLELAAPEGIVQRYAYLGPALAPILRRLLTGPAPVPHARNALTALETVLAAHPELPRTGQPVPRAPLPEPLSRRELQVLRCLARRLTNDEIGDELFISPITAKHHIANISEKLAVSGRRAAVARARELGLID